MSSGKLGQITKAGVGQMLELVGRTFVPLVTLTQCTELLYCAP